VAGLRKQQERRDSLRHPLALDVILRAGATGMSTTGKSVDISRSGIFVVLSDRIPEGRRVDIKIESPAVETPVITSGIVVHAVANVGLGIRFLHQNERTRELIGRMIESLKQSA
jgi:hypothetical protein